MTDIQVLTLLTKYYAASRDVALFVLWAMEDFEKGKEQHSFANLFLWCEAKDEREALWKRFKSDYPRAMMLKEGYYP